MLTLDQTTLFYFSLRDTPIDKDKLGLVTTWAAKVPSYAKKTCDPGPNSTQSTSTPPLTLASSHSSRSASSRAVKVTHANVEVISDTGGLSDHDETVGDERDLAIKSPPKGGRRLTSKVKFPVSPVLIHTDMHLRLLSRLTTHLSPHRKPNKELGPEDQNRETIACRKNAMNMVCGERQ